MIGTREPVDKGAGDRREQQDRKDLDYDDDTDPERGAGEVEHQQAQSNGREHIAPLRGGAS
jgi:hypothetical protein